MQNNLVAFFFFVFGFNTISSQTLNTHPFLDETIVSWHQFSVEEIDAITGSLIGRPSSATFRLQDLVGLDTGDNVSRFVIENVKNDKYINSLKKLPEPKFMRFLLDNKFLGNKTGKGFYEKTKKKDAKGKTIINALNLETLEYESAISPKLEIIKSAKGIGLMNKRLNYLIDGNSKEQKFFKDYFATLLEYSASRVPEISDPVSYTHLTLPTNREV